MNSNLNNVTPNTDAEWFDMLQGIDPTFTTADAIKQLEDAYNDPGVVWSPLGKKMVESAIDSIKRGYQARKAVSDYDRAMKGIR